jgi:pyridoxine kinase
MMKRQKRIALVNDITGFGRCSVAVQLPLISALKVQACVLPTAILSVHTGFVSHYIDDYTAHMRPYMENWQQNGIRFDGICTGFLGSAEQINIVLDFIKIFKEEDTRVMVDPVMGDYGRLYSSYTKEMCAEMRRLLAFADLLTPNLTETCQLLDIPYPQDGRVSDTELARMARELSERGPAQVVITGINEGGNIKNFIYERGNTPKVLCVPKIDGDRSGTGDAFTAIVSASLVQGETLAVAVKKAVDFISRVLVYTVELAQPWNYGLAFEEYLTELK